MNIMNIIYANKIYFKIYNMYLKVNCSQLYCILIVKNINSKKSCEHFYPIMEVTI